MHHDDCIAYHTRDLEFSRGYSEGRTQTEHCGEQREHVGAEEKGGRVGRGVDRLRSCLLIQVRRVEPAPSIWVLDGSLHLLLMST